MKVVRVVRRILIRVVAVSIVLLAAALWFYAFHLPGLVESEVLAALDELGLPDATARVAGVGFDGAVLTDLDLDGTGTVRAESIEVRYTLDDLLDGRVTQITVTGLTVTLGIADGTVDLGPLGRIERRGGEGGGESGELPFERIDLRACRLIVDREGDVRHFPLSGTLENVGRGRIDLEMTTRFTEKPVVVGGRLLTKDGTVDLRASGAGIEATLRSDRAGSVLDFTLAGRRERLSIFHEGRHVLGEGLAVDAQGRIENGRLKRASLSATATRFAHDGRVFRDLTVDVEGDADHLTGTVSGRCDLPAAGLDLGPEASAIVGGEIEVHPTTKPIRLKLSAVDATIRGLDTAGFRGNVAAKVAGEVSETGADLEILSARVTGEHARAPGPIDLRLGRPGTLTATLADSLDWSVDLPEVRLTASPALDGIGEAQVDASLSVVVTPEKIVGVVTEGSRVHSELVHVGAMTAEALVLEFVGQAVLTTDTMEVTVEGVPRVTAKAIRGRGLEVERAWFGADRVLVHSGPERSEGPRTIEIALPGQAGLGARSTRFAEYEFGRLNLEVSWEGTVGEGPFQGHLALLDSAKVTGPGLESAILAIFVEARGRIDRDGAVVAAGDLLLKLEEGTSEAAKTSLRDLRLDLPFVWGESGRAAAGTLEIGRMEVLGRVFAGPKLAVTQVGAGIDFEGDWEATESALFRLSGDARLTPQGPVAGAEFLAEPFYVSPTGPFGSIVKKLSGVSATGVVSTKGRIALDRGRIEPEISVSLSQAEVSYGEDTIALGNVKADVTIASFPPATPGGQRITWESARCGKLELGAGLLEFQVERDNAIAVERIRCATLPRGELRVPSFRLDPADPDLAIDLHCEEVSLSRWLTLLAEDKASGEGLLTGRIPLRIRTKPELEIEFSPGHLAAASGGWFRVHDMRAVEDLLDEHLPEIVGEVDYTQVVKDRVVQALRNFEYTSLRFEIMENDWNQTLRITTSGRGREIPTGLSRAQELDLTLNVNGFDTLIETVLATRLGIGKLFEGD